VAPAQGQPRKEPAQPAPAELTDRERLDRVSDQYYAGDYKGCARELGLLLDPKSGRRFTDPAVIQEAHSWHATCLLGDGQDKAAEQTFRRALETYRDMRPPPKEIFQQAVIDLFKRVQKELKVVEEEDYTKLRDDAKRAAEEERKRRAIEERRRQELTKLAENETIVDENSRLIAAIPFGVGQFQNRDVALGWTLLISEGVLLGTSLTSLGVYTSLRFQVPSNELPREDAQRIHNWYLAFAISSYALLGIAAGGIVHAQLSYEPEFRETRKRELPKELLQKPESSGFSWQPSVAAGPRGWQLGITGQF
jgi:hypothetical protein